MNRLKSTNVVAVVNEGERWLFLYDDESRPELLRVLGRYASNPDFNFSWYQAAVVAQKVRQEASAK